MHFYTFKNASVMNASFEDCLSKFLYGFVCLVLAEWLFRKKHYRLFSIIMSYRYLMISINFIIPLIYYNVKFPVINEDISVNLILYYFNEDYMLNYYVFYLYSAVHLCALYQIRFLKNVKLKFVFVFSIIAYLLTFLVNSNIVKIILNSSGFFVVFYYSYRNKFSILKLNVKRDILVCLYLLFTSVLIFTFISEQNNINFSFVYTIILLTAAVVLLVNNKIIRQIYLDVSTKLILLSLMVIGLYFSRFTAIEIMQYGVSFILIFVYMFGGLKIKKGIIIGSEKINEFTG
jgi:hypothetical protein